MSSTRIRAALEELLREGSHESCEHACECFGPGMAGWLAYDDFESNAAGGCWFSECHCATDAQRMAADALMGKK